MSIFVRTAVGALALSCAATAYAQTPLKVGDKVQGVLEAREAKDGEIIDNFTLQGTRGQRVTITLTSDAFDALVHVDRGEEHVGEDDDGGGELNARLVVDFAASGPHQVFVTSAERNQTGPYTLTVERGGEVRVPAQTVGNRTQRQRPNPQAIRLGQTLHGRLTPVSPLDGEARPYQPFTFRGRQGEQITIDLKSTEFDAYLTLKRAGEIGSIESDDDGGNNSNSRISLRLPATASYEVQAAALSEDATGGFEISVREGDIPAERGEFNDGELEAEEAEPFLTAAPARASPITLGQTINGKLDDSDPQGADQTRYDAYRFQASANQSLVIRMRASFDTYLYLFDSSGKEVEHNDDADGTNSELSITLTAPGDYFILANGVTTADIGDYTLTVNAPGR